jgi:hypothetical protein
MLAEPSLFSGSPRKLPRLQVAAALLAGLQDVERLPG